MAECTAVVIVIDENTPITENGVNLSRTADRVGTLK